ncbi:hypothetical protein HOD30_03300 [Candidatus Peregrinibacteria bacterium]|jgi:hypothetical protein|nr:hypothetical protein [Candidatus Peregrinibacteria bacterium]MBT4631666.1 hypothetical protein [Candidatus Peregrinibacteria bacterium]MBT5516794.1 hypothetical protein [Candidatus Peregrinibacteria bacterium]MBT5823924.1 hypothetical protein [Candidatus Peregrinibacteria bacterium]
MSDIVEFGAFERDEGPEITIAKLRGKVVENLDVFCGVSAENRGDIQKELAVNLMWLLCCLPDLRPRKEIHASHTFEDGDDVHALICEHIDSYGLPDDVRVEVEAAALAVMDDMIEDLVKIEARETGVGLLVG